MRVTIWLIMFVYVLSTDEWLFGRVEFLCMAFLALGLSFVTDAIEIANRWMNKQ